MLVLVGLELGALDELAEYYVRLDPQLVVLVFHLLKLIHFLRPRHLLQRVCSAAIEAFVYVLLEILLVVLITFQMLSQLTVFEVLKVAIIAVFRASASCLSLFRFLGVVFLDLYQSGSPATSDHDRLYAYSVKIHLIHFINLNQIRKNYE